MSEWKIDGFDDTRTVPPASQPSSHYGLGIDRATGRLKWCPGCKCIKLLLLLPTIMLPIIFFVILTMQLSLVQSRELSQVTINDYNRHGANNRKLNIPCHHVQHYATESFDVDDKEILRDVRTSFVPPQSSTLLPNCRFEWNESISDEHFYIRNNNIDGDVNGRTVDGDAALQNGVIDLNREKPVELRTHPSGRRRRDTLNDTQPQQDVQSLGEQQPRQSIETQSFWNSEGNSNEIRASQTDVMKQFMDLESEPCEDFYQYACGNWEKLNPIPKDKAAYDTFEMLRENLDIVLNNLLNETGLAPAETDSVTKEPLVVAEVLNTIDVAVTDHQTSGVSSKKVRRRSTEPLEQSRRNSRHHSTVPSVAEEKAKDLYESCMNQKVLRERGIEPLLSLLKRFGGWPALHEDWDEEAFNWIELAAQLRLYNNDVFLMQWVGPDIKNSDEHVIQFDQTSLGLPTRDYFLQPMNSAYLQAYEEYARSVITLLGAHEAYSAKVAEEIVGFETQLAGITAAPEERVNVSQLYKRMTIERLQQHVLEIDWQRYLEIVLERPVAQTETIVMFAMNFMQDLVVLLNNTEPRVVANYMLWKFVRHRINNLDDRFQEAKQRFYYVLIGREQSPPRWKICVNQVNSNMGMAVGAMFVRRYFDEKSKQDTLAMTHELQESFQAILNETDWIDAPTKHLAELKVLGMSLKIGYPDIILEPRDLDEKYKDLTIDRGQYFENILNVLLHLTRTEQSKVFEVVNKTAWNTAPAVVNAYYSRNKNQIMFPAGILQPPFYHRYFPRSLNYGGIGVVIGHELTHGFDDKGRLFDRDGNLNRWWSDAAIEGFHHRASCLISQYGNYTMAEVGGMPVDGAITQGENIADNGGIKQAFRAYKKWLTANCQSAECLERESLPGINATHTQLFFINFAQVWCGAMRPEATKNKMKTAVHSPGRFRVIGTLSNSEDFAREFQCPKGSAMNPASKCSVW